MTTCVHWSLPAPRKPRRTLLARTARRLFRRPDTWAELVLVVFRWAPVAGSLAWALMGGRP